LFGYIDKNGIITSTPLETLYAHKRESVQKSSSTPSSKEATQGESLITKDPSTQKKALESYQDSKHYLEAGIQNVLAAQIMSNPVVTVTPETTIKQAWELFRKKRFRHIPVIDKYEKVVGIVSDRDVLNLGINLNNDEDQAEKAKLIGSLMKSKVLFARPKSEIRQIVFVLIQQKIGAMPILSDEGILLGIITRSDILKHFVSNSVLDLSA
jgi:acetoin utilization protein AcuB